MKKKYLKIETFFFVSIILIALSSLYFIYENQHEIKKVNNEILSISNLFENIQKYDYLENYKEINSELVLSNNLTIPSLLKRNISAQSQNEIKLNYVKVKERTCQNLIAEINENLKKDTYNISINGLEYLKLKSIGYKVCNDGKNNMEIILKGLKSVSEREREEMNRLEALNKEKALMEAKKQAEVKKIKALREELKKKRQEEILKEMEDERKYFLMMTPENPADIQLKYTSVSPIENSNNTDLLIDEDISKAIDSLTPENFEYIEGENG